MAAAESQTLCFICRYKTSTKVCKCRYGHKKCLKEYKINYKNNSCQTCKTDYYYKFWSITKKDISELSSNEIRIYKINLCVLFSLLVISGFLITNMIISLFIRTGEGFITNNRFVEKDDIPYMQIEIVYPLPEKTYAMWSNLLLREDVVMKPNITIPIWLLGNDVMIKEPYNYSSLFLIWVILYICDLLFIYYLFHKIEGI